MKKILMSLAAISTITFAGGNISAVAPIVEAEPCPEFTPQAYIGIAGTYSEFSYTFLPTAETIDDVEDTIGFQGQIGYDIFGQNGWVLGVEARAGYAEVDAFDATYLAAYLKPQYNFDKFGIYGLLGYGQTTFSASADIAPYTTLTIEDTTDDFTWGAGLKYSFNETFDVFVDYVALPDWELGNTDEIDSDIVSLGVNYKF
jgi:opacity protein-like surface antigen